MEEDDNDNTCMLSLEPLPGLLLPEHADKLLMQELPWYCCWSNELAAETH